MELEQLLKKWRQETDIQDMDFLGWCDKNGYKLEYMIMDKQHFETIEIS